jgi:hypothetical protein
LNELSKGSVAEWQQDKSLDDDAGTVFSMTVSL